ncbi:unnamed protein product [Clavelina lepadiformis]|uniref:Phospholipase A2 n=1 Tax=Clavelina lepadiformis TaxID=159417 RepID=A0ABP0FST0_CLALP
MSTEDLIDFYHFEDSQHQRYDNYQVKFNPTVVLTLKLLRCRKVSVSFWRDKFDKPDPQFKISCPSIPGSKEVNTLNIKENTPTCEINETFKFIIPDEMKDVDSLPVVIKLFDRDVFSDDFIGKKTIDAAKELQLGETIFKTIDFDSHGELDVEVTKILRRSPDFRHSLGLHPDEKKFRKKRLPVVYESLKKILGSRKLPKSLNETPVVSLVTSGGGYRAAVGMCGAMEALNDAGLMDIFTYAAGLSGSAWYLMSAYALKGILPDSQQKFHQGLREKFENSLTWDMVNPITFASYKKYLKQTKDRYKQPHSFVDYFPGYLVGKHMLGKKNMDTKITDLQDYVKDGKVPLPIFASLHVKSSVRASTFHAYLEQTPYEVALPEFAMGLAPDTVGSTWTGGFLVNKRPEFPLHFSQGMTGCAFSILLQTFLKDGNEDSVELSKFIDSERIDGKKAKVNRLVEVESDDSDTEDDEDEAPTYVMTKTPTKTKDSKTHQALVNSLSGISFFTNRNALIGRSAKIINFAFGLNSIERYLLNPFGDDDMHCCGGKQELIEKVGVQKATMSMSTKKNTLSFVDAGILFNTPTSVVLRPQRCPDLMIVMDFTAYESDDAFDYSTVMSAAAHAWRAGLHFPQMDFEKITNLPPKEFLIFPSDDDDCPTILWFTLCNKTFKNLKDYTPRSKERPKDGSKFNDFPVLNEGSAYSTFTFQYDKLDFDRLRELMYFNVTSHIEEIKKTIEEAVVRRRRRLGRAAKNKY